MIQSCFSQPNTPSSKTSRRHDHHDHDHDQMPNQNLVTCIYQTQVCNSPTYLTLTWSKTLFSHTLTIFAPNLFSITLSLQPSTFSLFRPKPSSSKSIHLTHHRHYQKLKLYWDFTRAEFNASAEPESRFYLALVFAGQVEFFLGDLADDLAQRAGAARAADAAAARPSLISRREHVFGRGSYASRAVLSGTRHEIGIECSNAGGSTLKVRVDGELRLVVKRLAWKFRGNEKIFFGGVEVEFFWDVFNWVNGGSDNGDGAHGVFVFQVAGESGGVWPEMVGPEKRLLRKSLSSSPTDKAGNVNVGANNNNNNNNCYYNYFGGSSALSTQSPSCSSVLQWAEESSDGGSRSSCSSSTRSCGSNGGFSLLLYAWRKD